MYRLSRAPCLSATVLEGSRAAKRLFSSRADMERTITAGAMQTPPIMHACLTASPRGFPVRLRPSCGANRPAWCGGYRSGRPQPLRAIAAPVEPLELQTNEEIDFIDRTGKGLAEAPPFTLADIKQAIPEHCLKKDTWRSMSYLAKDVAIVLGLAVGAHSLHQWWAWPFYWVAQGTMFWALFVVGHDCGHGSFSNNRVLNDLVGNITHSSILVPYHGWRISHRTHHQNHGHVENDESWHPIPKRIYDDMEPLARLGRLSFPAALFAYPFYLWQRSPGKKGAHYDPMCDLFAPNERHLIKTSNKFMQGFLVVLAASTMALGPVSMFNLYFMPYWVFVLCLDVVTYLHHHGTEDKDEQVPWYRGEEWSYLRGGLSTLDRDYGIFNKIHHDIGTHVLHHLFPQVPHYHLEDATEAVKPVLGKYYREPAPSPGLLPTHLLQPLIRSFQEDHYVDDTGDVVFYKKDPEFNVSHVGGSK